MKAKLMQKQVQAWLEPTVNYIQIIPQIFGKAVRSSQQWYDLVPVPRTLIVFFMISESCFY